jgi:Tol biopolymer transport system component
MAIFDVGSQDGMHFLVSEFLDGQSLREVISAGPIPQRKLIVHALQIAKGLAAAHDKGIIHRDLKPENIFVLHNDHVKILDFGLAKQATPASTDSNSDDNATMTSPHRTAAGTVLGTAAYMSPEQVRGEPVDHRSDIFSFGAILYEMAAGKRAFKGDSGVEVMHSVLKAEPPDLSESGVQVPLGLQRIIQRCLEKKPEARFQSASDLAFALDSLSSTGSAGTSGSGLRALKTDQPAERKPPPTLFFAAAVIAAALIGALATWFLHNPSSIPPSFTQISSVSQYIRNARFAPDGRTVVYGAIYNAGVTELFSNRTDSAEQHSLGIHAEVLGVSSTGELAVTVNPNFDPLWTPTGRLARIPLGGGTPRELLDSVIDADWAPDGSALAVSRKVGSRWHLEYPAGKVLYETAGYISDLRFSPAGDQIAFIDHAILGDDRGLIDVIDLKGQRRALTPEFTSAQGLAWSPNGKEIWFTGQATSEPMVLRAVDLRGRMRTLIPSAVRLHLQDVAKDGTVLLTTEDFRWQTLLADTGKAPRDISAFQWQYTNAISRDGGMVLFNAYTIGPDMSYYLFIQRSNESSPVMIGEGAGTGISFDSKWVSALDPVHLDQLHIIPTGVGEAPTVHLQGMNYLASTWMPDGQHLLIVAAAPGHAPATYVQSIDTGAVQQISPDGKFVPNRVNVPVDVSPDGKFCVTTDAENHYWIQPTDGSPARDLPGILPDERPIEWHNDSAHLFVARQNGTDVEISDVNVATGEHKLFLRYSPTDRTAALAVTYIAITPDGAHYAYVVPHIYSTLFVARGVH